MNVHIAARINHSALISWNSKKWEKQLEKYDNQELFIIAAVEKLFGVIITSIYGMYTPWNRVRRARMLISRLNLVECVFAYV